MFEKDWIPKKPTSIEKKDNGQTHVVLTDVMYTELLMALERARADCARRRLNAWIQGYAVGLILGGVVTLWLSL